VFNKNGKIQNIIEKFREVDILIANIANLALWNGVQPTDQLKIDGLMAILEQMETKSKVIVNEIMQEMDTIVLDKARKWLKDRGFENFTAYMSNFLENYIKENGLKIELKLGLDGDWLKICNGHVDTKHFL